MNPAAPTLDPGNTSPLDRHRITPPALAVFNDRFGEAPHFQIYPQTRTAFWPSTGDGSRCDGLIIAHGDDDDSWASCTEQIMILSEELALKGLAPWSVVASVGGTDLPPDERYDLKIATDLYHASDLQWVAFLDYRTLTTNDHAIVLLPCEFEVPIHTFPLEEPADVPGRAGEGKLIDPEETTRFHAEFTATDRVPAADWDEVPSAHGVYAIYPTASAVADGFLPPDDLITSVDEEQPLYVGRTLDEDLNQRLDRHAARIDGAENLRLEWFEARYVELPDARLAYRAKQAVRDGVPKPVWQRSGFAL